MSRKRFIIGQTVWTPIVGVASTLAFGAEHWYLAAPLGLILGPMVGFAVWPVMVRLRARNERILNEREARANGYPTGGGQ
jgi:hypothetical protein